MRKSRGAATRGRTGNPPKWGNFPVGLFLSFEVARVRREIVATPARGRLPGRSCPVSSSRANLDGVRNAVGERCTPLLKTVRGWHGLDPRPLSNHAVGVVNVSSSFLKRRCFVILTKEIMGPIRRRPGQVTDSAADRGDVRGAFIGRPRDAASPAAAPAKGAAEMWLGKLVDLLTAMMADSTIQKLLGKGTPAAARPALSTGIAGAEAPDNMKGEDHTGSALPAQATDAAARGLDDLLPARRLAVSDSASSLTMLMATGKEHTEPASLDGLITSIRAHRCGR